MLRRVVRELVTAALILTVLCAVYVAAQYLIYGSVRW